MDGSSTRHMSMQEWLGIWDNFIKQKDPDRKERLALIDYELQLCEQWKNIHSIYHAVHEIDAMDFLNPGCEFSRPMISFVPQNILFDFHYASVGGGRWMSVVQGRIRLAIIPPTDKNLFEFDIWHPGNTEESYKISNRCENVVRASIHGGQGVVIPPGWLLGFVVEEDTVYVGSSFFRSDCLRVELSVSRIISQDSASNTENRWRKIFWQVAEYFGRGLLKRIEQVQPKGLQPWQKAVFDATHDIDTKLKVLKDKMLICDEQEQHIVTGVLSSTNNHASDSSSGSQSEYRTKKSTSCDIEQRKEDIGAGNKMTTSCCTPKAAPLPSAGKLKIRLNPPSEMTSPLAPSPSSRRIKLKVPPSPQPAMWREQSDCFAKVMEATNASGKNPPMVLPQTPEEVQTDLRRLYVELSGWKTKPYWLRQYCNGFPLSASLAHLQVALEEMGIINPGKSTLVKDSGSAMFSQLTQDLIKPEDDVLLEECGETPRAADDTPNMFTAHHSSLDTGVGLGKSPPKQAKSPKTSINSKRLNQHSTAKERLAKKLGISF